jgi:hypothetical protein
MTKIVVTAARRERTAHSAWQKLVMRSRAKPQITRRRCAAISGRRATTVDVARQEALTPMADIA